MRGRRRRARCIGLNPSHTCFKPCGIRGRHLDTVTLQADEFEALRLMDYEGLYQEEGARRMGVSRTTLSRNVAQARRKLLDALLNGKVLLIGIADPATITDAGTHPDRLQRNRSEPGERHTIAQPGNRSGEE